MLAVGVQMQAIVVPPASRADIIGFPEYRDVQTCRAHRRGACES
jgi:hypothetical protein